MDEVIHRHMGYAAFRRLTKKKKPSHCNPAPNDRASVLGGWTLTCSALLRKKPIYHFIIFSLPSTFFMLMDVSSLQSGLL